jgi:hypothetical protein
MIDKNGNKTNIWFVSRKYLVNKYKKHEKDIYSIT